MTQFNLLRGVSKKTIISLLTLGLILLAGIFLGTKLIARYQTSQKAQAGKQLESIRLTPQTSNISLSKKKVPVASFKINEPIKFKLTLPKKQSSLPNFAVKSASAQEQSTYQSGDLTVSATVILAAPPAHPKADVNIQFTPTSNGEVDITVLPKDPRSFRGSQYQLQADITKSGENRKITHDFTWGVLTVNTNKSIFTPGETVYLQMASLNEYGKTLCGSNLKLEITDPAGKTAAPEIQKSNTCGADNVTDNPDYFAYYDVQTIGSYSIKLTNTDNNYNIDDSFEVKESVPFVVERIGATRINPYKSAYTMNIKVTANQDFSGDIVETTPLSFQIATASAALSASSSATPSYNVSQSNNTNQITWSLDLKLGQQVTLSYTYQAPEISPEIFLLGPLSLTSGVGPNSPEVFRESRSWQLASDAATCLGTGGGNFTTDATWTSCNEGTGTPYPLSVDTAVICNGKTVTMANGDTYTISALTIGDNVSCTGGSVGAGTLNWQTSGGTGSLTVSNATTMSNGKIGTLDMTNGGTLTTKTFVNAGAANTKPVLTAGAGTIVVTGTGTLISATNSTGWGVYNNLTVNGSGVTVSLGQAITAANNILLTAGTLDATTSNYNITFSGTWTNNSSSTAFTARSATVTFAGTSQSTNGSQTTSFYDVTINNTSTVTANTNFSIGSARTLTVNGTLQPAATVVINSGGATGTLTGSGAVYVNGATGTNDFSTQLKFSTYTLTNLTIYYNGTNQGMDNYTYNNLTISGSMATGTQTAGVNGIFTVTGTFTPTGGTITMNNGSSIANSGTVTFQALTIASAATVTTSASFSIAGALTNSSTATFNPSAGTVTMNNGSSIANSGTSLTFTNLTIAANATVTSSGSFTVNSAFTVNSGANFTAPSATLTVGGNFTNSGTFTHNSGTVAFNSAAAGNTINPGSSSFYNVTFTTTSRWVATGNGSGAGANTLAYSSDGLTWSGLGTATFGGNARGAAWNGIRWVAAGTNGGSGNTLAYSSDGITWTGLGTTVFGGLASAGYAVGWNGTRWVAGGVKSTGSNTLAYSSDGLTWSGLGTTIFPNQGYGAAWNGTYWVQVGGDGGGATGNTLAYSSDGITWTGLGTTIFTTRAFGVAWSGTRWVAGGVSTAAGGSSLAYSSDGITWTGLGTAIFGGTTPGGYAVAWNGTRWVAGGQLSTGSNTQAYSSDGITWSGLGTTAFSSHGYYTTWNGVRWVGGGDGSALPGNTLAYSSDGLTWTGLGSSIFNTSVLGLASAPAPEMTPKITGIGSGSWTFGSNSATVTNNFTINSGTVTAPSTTLTVSGNFTNNDTFTHNSGTVSLNGADASTQSLLGSSTTFYNLSVTAPSSSSKTIQFDASSTTTISNTLTLSGTSCTAAIFLKSSSAGTAWKISPPAGTSLSYLNVQDSSSDKTITATSSLNATGNTNWSIDGSCGTKDYLRFSGLELKGVRIQ